MKTVARYNELVDAGVDEDMGKPAKWLKPIKQAPSMASIVTFACLPSSMA